MSVTESGTFSDWVALASPIELHLCREDLAERMRLIDDELAKRRLVLGVVRDVRESRYLEKEARYLEES